MLTITEATGNANMATYTVRLASQPAADVTVTVTVGGDISSSRATVVTPGGGNTVVFTDAIWDRPTPACSPCVRGWSAPSVLARHASGAGQHLRCLLAHASGVRREGNIPQNSHLPIATCHIILYTVVAFCGKKLLPMGRWKNS